MAAPVIATAVHGFGDYGSGGGSIDPPAPATSTQQTGIVDIVSMLGYRNAEAAGTGMVLTSNGNVLTNSQAHPDQRRRPAR